MKEEHYIQPIHQSEDGVANSYTGLLVDYNNPNTSMICIEDIATGLRNICRFGGQIREHYSVAEHTLLVWYLCPDHLKQAALLHDAAEAYLGDVVKPLKHLIGPLYRPYEKRFEEIIFMKYGVDINLLEEVKPYDRMALEIENNYFRFGNLDFIQKFYEINELLRLSDAKIRFLMLLRAEFYQKEIGG